GRGGSILIATPWAVVFSGISAVVGICVILFASGSQEITSNRKQFFPLVLLSLSGLYGLMTAGDLFNIYLFSELLCISACGMIMVNRKSGGAVQAALKYLIMGTTATLIMLLGLALVYRDNGQILMSAISGTAGLWGRIGAGCFVIGFGLKIGSVPLHGWLPDAYDYAPDAVSGLLAGIISISALFILPGIGLSLGLRGEELGLILLLSSFLNMFVGNITALTQKKPKRVLAYSSIAYTGYMMFSLGIGLYFNMPDAWSITFFLFIGHAVMKSLAFLSLGLIKDGAVRFPHGRELFSRTVFFISIAGLAGIPPLAGFVGKWVVIAEALNAKNTLASIGIALFLINSLISLGYYLPMLRLVFAVEKNQGIGSSKSQRIPFVMILSLVILSSLVLWIGIQPTNWMDWAAWFGPK
ncbi:MAG: proton-conducting transporter membrane subunit, partial [Chloroflexota bacterium]